jgi:hypothetical protein
LLPSFLLLLPAAAAAAASSSSKQQMLLRDTSFKRKYLLGLADNAFILHQKTMTRFLSRVAVVLMCSALHVAANSVAFCGLQQSKWTIWPAYPTPSEGIVYANASYNASFLDIGWDVLHVAAVQGNDSLAAYAAGLCEGYLTQNRSAQMIRNSEGGAPYDNLTNAFLDTNERWMRAQIADNPDDEYWVAMSLVLQQLQGIADGYSLARQPSDPVVDFEFLRKFNLDQGDVYDVMCIVNRSQCAKTHPSVSSSDGSARLFSAARGHCTSLLKFAPDFQELFVGHTTWDDYFSALRIWKVRRAHAEGAAPAVRAVFVPLADSSVLCCTFQFQHLTSCRQVYHLPFATSRSAKVGMSSYPLTIVSSDDFVYTDQQV